MRSIQNFGFVIRNGNNGPGDYANICPTGQSCCEPKPQKLVCDENDGYKCHPSKVCNFLHLQFSFEVHFQFFLQKCSSNVKGNSAPTLRDYNYDDDEVDLVPKRGEDENEYCPIGETCCIPQIPKCEDFEGYSCTSENVSLSLWIHEKPNPL